MQTGDILSRNYFVFSTNSIQSYVGAHTERRKSDATFQLLNPPIEEQQNCLHVSVLANTHGLHYSCCPISLSVISKQITMITLLFIR